MPILTTAEVAKRTRNDIKAAVKAGELVLPAGVTIGVTSRDRLTIEIRGATQEWAWTADRYQMGAQLTDAARTLGRQLAAIAKPHHAQGYDFGFVMVDSACAASLGKPGWTPGQD